MNDVRMSHHGQPVEIVVQGEQNTFSLNEKALENILLKKPVQNMKVVVLSIAGAFRKGKSFLLNFLLRFMKKVLAGLFPLKTSSADYHFKQGKRYISHSSF